MRYAIEKLGGTPRRCRRFDAPDDATAKVIADEHVREWRSAGYHGGCQLVRDGIGLVVVYSRGRALQSVKRFVET